jgi:hypothetical protein
MVIGKQKYLIEPGRGTYYPTMLTSFPWAHGECKSSHGQRRFVVRGPLYSRTVALFL